MALDFCTYGIKPNGIIKGGSASYTLTADGIIHWASSLTIQVLFFSHTYENAGTYPVDLKQILSVLCKPGHSIAVGQAFITVLSEDTSAKTAKLRIVVPGYAPITLIAYVGGVYIKPVYLWAQESVLGFDMTIEAFNVK